MNLKTQTFLVLGVSRSGEASAEYILGKGGKCKIYEEMNSPKLTEVIKKLEQMGAENVSNLEIDKVLENVSVVVVSPGVPINHKICVQAKQNDIRLCSELEFGFCASEPIKIAVTGTNGKTTTVSLVNHILTENGVKSLLVGNVGEPVSSKVDEITSSTICVTEVSSFQLESIHTFSPHIACVLNVSPDHLERHYSMENYVFLKKRMVKNLTSSDYAVLNYDDKIVKEFYKDTRAKALYISLYNRTNGAYREGNSLFFDGEFIIEQSDLTLPGEHNVYNTLFAIVICKLCGLTAEEISSTLKTFRGVKHRTELVMEKNGIKYYNDSKATNTASTISAINMMNAPTTLILGGSEKGEDYIDLFTKIKESFVKHTIITGESRIHMLDAAGKIGYGDMTIIKDFDTAIRFSKLIACEGENVLFSPACASFDNFKNYQERGERFVSILEEQN